jgi:hypothetical protein
VLDPWQQDQNEALLGHRAEEGFSFAIRIGWI